MGTLARRLVQVKDVGEGVGEGVGVQIRRDTTDDGRSGERPSGGDLAGSDGPVPADEPGLDRILTVPNAITLVRLACIPLFLWLLFGADRQTAAAVLLAALGATDWVDGFVARRYHQVSTVGKVLDPVADRVLVVTAVIAIIVHGAVPVWFGAATLAREVVVSGAVLLLASLGATRIDVLWIGKAGTFALMFAYPAFLLGYGNARWQEPIRVVAWITGLVGLVLAWAAAASYVPVARRALADGRRARAERRAVVKAVIMAGGEGTRLRPLTSNQPKPMLPMANIPMMEHVVNLLRQHGFEDIVVTVAFMANAIRTYFGDGSEFGVRMVYATESTPLGTAGSVRNARDELDESFLVISGDVLTDIDLTQVVEFHRQRGRAGHPGPQGGRQPARVRHRHHQRGRVHRAVPREAHLGPGVQRHHQHRHLRAGAGDLRLHPRGAAGGLLRRVVPRRPGGREGAVRVRGRRLLGGRRHPRGLPQGPPGHPRPARPGGHQRLRAAAPGVAGQGCGDRSQRGHRRPGRHRRQLRGGPGRPPRPVLHPRPQHPDRRQRRRWSGRSSTTTPTSDRASASTGACSGRGSDLREGVAVRGGVGARATSAWSAPTPRSRRA